MNKIIKLIKYFNIKNLIMTNLNWWNQQGDIKLPEVKKSSNKISENINDLQKLLEIYWPHLKKEEFNILKYLLDDSEFQEAFNDTSFNTINLWVEYLIWWNRLLYDLENRIVDYLNENFDNSCNNYNLIPYINHHWWKDDSWKNLEIRFSDWFFECNILEENPVLERIKKWEEEQGLLQHILVNLFWNHFYFRWFSDYSYLNRKYINTSNMIKKVWSHKVTCWWIDYIRWFFYADVTDDVD